MSSFIEPRLDVILKALDTLTHNQQPSWGAMKPQEMVEHLSDVLKLSVNTSKKIQLTVPEEKLPKLVAILKSDEPMPKNFKAPFVPSEIVLRNEELELAVDELADCWLNFELFFENDTDKTTVHPIFGPLNFDLWKRLHSKHFTHHLSQFGLL